SRFSPNTFPSWALAHPYRVICHNGEINTLMGNVNWMRARESQLASELFGIDLQMVMPIVRPGGSDSATFDNVLELLMLAGRSLPHAVMMMIPEAYADRDELPAREPLTVATEPLRARQLALGYTQEDLRVLLSPMAKIAEEPIGSMGNDAALAVLSDQRPPLFSYFKQLFAQVTNPPIDSIRESIVMSLGTGVGSESNLLEETPEHAHQLVMDQPILRNDELETLRRVSSDVFKAYTIDITWPVSEGPEGMAARLANA